jgi:drug/metabolite transporter (DMT)-like permease
LLLAASLVMGEHMVAVPSWRAIWAMVYLAIFGSLVGFCAYNYLLTKVRPALATSYAYVNPAAAVLLGAWLLDERICTTELAAMLIILTGVVMVVLGQRH